MLHYSLEDEKIIVEQISFILGKDYVMPFQERKEDAFESIKETIKYNRCLIKGTGANFLLTSMIDSIEDNYLNICGILEDESNIDDGLLVNPSQKTVNEINSLKRQMIFIRKITWPLREILNRLLRIGTPFTSQKTVIYLRDIHDHIIQIIDLIETLQEVLSSMVDTCLSNISNRTNEVMKILTLIATIFIPLTFYRRRLRYEF